MESQILEGSANSVLPTLPENSVDCVVTSPPYWGLRDYKMEGQIGNEASPETYINRLTQVFREVRRVLKPTGTLWVNISDTILSQEDRVTAGEWATSLKPKDLIGLPWRLAFALQADGWWLRSDVIWFKPNPMPESATNRPGRCHEYIFLLTKSPDYYYDLEAVKVKSVSFETDSRAGQGNIRYTTGKRKGEEGTGQEAFAIVREKRNLRSVWEIAVQGYGGAHFAVFPNELPSICIRAGSSEKGCCPQCGAPWERLIEEGDDGEPKTVGWQPTCPHSDAPVPCTVLDPFSGSGTTGVVAVGNGRNYIGIELNPEYCKLSDTRIYNEVGLLLQD